MNVERQCGSVDRRIVKRVTEVHVQWSYSQPALDLHSVSEDLFLKAIAAQSDTKRS